jgi:hypothetical protein
MGKKDRGTVKETEAERALAQNAMQRLADYRQRWQPVQQRLATEIRSMGKDDSFERKQLAGKVATDTRAAYSQAGEAAEAAQLNAGINPASSKFKLGISEAAADEARSLGVGVMGADQAIDDAYVRGLASIMSIGRGTQAEATSNLSSLAGVQAAQARSDAEASAARRSGNRRMAGVALGTALSAGMPGQPRPGNPAMTSRAPSSVGINADPFSGI